MLNRISKEKVFAESFLLKEVGYVVLLVTFFMGIVLGAISLKQVNFSDSSDYFESFNDTFLKLNSSDNSDNLSGAFYNGLNTILIYWVIGLSTIGAPVLIAHLGYKGYSLGYTISAIIKLVGTEVGYNFIFKFLFIKNIFLVFFMVVLANYSIKVSKNYFDKNVNIKGETLKYTALVAFVLIVWILINSIERLIFTIF